MATGRKFMRQHGVLANVAAAAELSAFRGLYSETQNDGRGSMHSIMRSAEPRWQGVQSVALQPSQQPSAKTFGHRQQCVPQIQFFSQTLLYL